VLWLATSRFEFKRGHKIGPDESWGRAGFDPNAGGSGWSAFAGAL